MFINIYLKGNLMKKNDIFEGVVVDYTHDGLGVVKIDNFPLFVEDVVVGETVKVKVLKLKKNLGWSKLVEIITPSENRVEVSEKTSGANLLHLKYEEQLRFKTNKVKNIMDKTVGKDTINVLDTIGMVKPYNYRNKSVMPVQFTNGEIKIGYYQPRSHNVINSYNCSIQYIEHNDLTNKVRELLNKMQLSIYNEENHSGALRHIMFRTNSAKSEIMVGIIAKGNFARLDDFVKELVALDDRIKSVVLNINAQKTNVIFGDETRVLYGDDYITDELDGIRFNISLRSFYQVNPVQTEVLYGKAIELANLQAEDTIIDAYCGIGTISLFAAKKVKKVYGIEIVEQAIINARENALTNKITNAEFLLGKSEDVIKDLIAKNETIDAVIVDPPRKGCEDSFLRDLASMDIKKIVYVSCNPATLARDIQILMDLGYKANDVQPVDMFPGTYHVETVVLMSKVK